MLRFIQAMEEGTLIISNRSMMAMKLYFSFEQVLVMGDIKNGEHKFINNTELYET